MVVRPLPKWISPGLARRGVQRGEELHHGGANLCQNGFPRVWRGVVCNGEKEMVTMSKPEFADIFSGEFLGYVTKYRERIQKILNEYEVVIFMARKAICFYKAMKLNKELDVPNICDVFSSRIISYNILHKYKGKKIAIVDDVVVKGESLKRVVSKLTEYNIKADILVVACNVDIETDFKKFDYPIFKKYVVLEQKDVYSFAGMITEYIEASMCSFNIDQPIYTVDIENHALKELLYENYALDISSSTQQYYSIMNKIIYLRLKQDIPNDSPLFLLKRSILKIRILSNKTRTIAVPFVLLPEITSEQLEQLFSLIKTKDIMLLVEVNNKHITRENKMKIISYFLSEALMHSFFREKDINFKKQDDNEAFQFFENINISFECILQNSHKNNDFLQDSLTPTYVEYSTFELPYLLASCYQTISEIDPAKQCFINSENEVITKEIIVTHEMFYQNIQSNTINSMNLASCAIDIFIDRGMVVPSIVHTKNNNIVRAYKMGEYSKLTRSQIEFFVAMLYQYQGMVNDSLNKTEFEKLCVLFFKMAITRGIFSQQERYENGSYSICYSLYGPRISTSAISYKVESDSALITEFCSLDKKLVTTNKGKYIINNPTAMSQQQRGLAYGFAYQYYALRTLFMKAEKEREKIKIKKTPWNRYVHTYIQYLTLRAIGGNQKNQFLSLCAELYQATFLPECFFELDEKNRQISERILSGINSGLWKFWCFSNDALNKTTQQILEKNKNVGALLLLDQEQPSDQREEWRIAIDRAGKLLYEIAFFINETLKIKHKVSVYSIGDGISESEENKHEAKEILFTLGSYYNSNKDIYELRHTVKEIVEKHSRTPNFDDWCKIHLKKLKQMARLQLDMCDVILNDNNPSITYFTKYLIVYSRNGIFTDSFSNANAARRELKLDGILNNHTIKIYGLTHEQKAVALLSELFANEGQEQLRYLVLDLDDPILETFTQKQDGYGKNSILASKINEIIEQLAKEKLGHDLFVVSAKSCPNEIKHENICLNSSSTSSESINKFKECFSLSSTDTPIIINYFKITIQIQGDNNGLIGVAENGGEINIDKGGI